MTTETAVKPLHVRVAEALGDDLGPCSARYIEDQLESGRGDSGWYCNDCGFSGEYAKDGPQSYEHSRPAREYDTNWCLTGPVMERLGIAVRPVDREFPSGVYSWGAFPPPGIDAPWQLSRAGALPAVCEMILALHEAGELPVRG